MRKLLRPTLFLLVVAAGFLLAGDVQTTNLNVELKSVEIKSVESELKLLEKQYDSLLQDTELNNKQFEKKLNELEAEKKRLEAELVAKRARDAQAAKNVAYASSVPQTYVNTGNWVTNCHNWASQAGVSLNSWAIELIRRESGCNPNAQNPTSTAYGIGQFLNSTWAGQGCVKTSDPVTQLKCMQTYVMNRYGSWQKAVYWHDSHNWY